MKRIIILYVVSTLRRTGPTQQLHYIIRSLDRAKFQPCILTLSSEPQDSMSSVFQELDIVFNTLNLSRLDGFFRGKSELEKLLKTIKPELVHTQGIRADKLILELKDKHKLPIVTTARNNPFEDYPDKFGKIRGGIMAWSHTSILRQIPNLVACGKSLSEQLKKYNISSRIICNGVDTDKFSPLESIQERNALRETLNLPLSSKIFVTVGSLIPRKDPLLIIEAFFRARLQNSMLIILGSGFLENDCQKLLEKNSSSSDVRFIGQVSDVRPWLRCSDIFISAAKSEGLPNAVLEAMSCGLPAILSDIPPHREIIEGQSSEVGQLFPTGNIEMLIKAIKSFSTTNENTTRQLILENFNARVMSQTYQSLYEEIV